MAKKKPKIEGGYIMIARKIDWSSIAESPPYAREVWFYLLRAANFQDNHICKRGQTIRRYIDIREALKWYVGWRKHMYTIAQCENAMKLLVKANMITKRRTTRGLCITICNYDTYQTPANYESQFHSPVTKVEGEPQSSQMINKKDNKEKKKELTRKFIPPTLQDVTDYAKSRNSSLEPKVFFEYFDVSGWADSRGNKVKNWKQKFISWESRNGRQASETGQRQFEKPATSGSGVNSVNSDGDFIR